MDLSTLATNIRENNCSKSFEILLKEVDPLIHHIVRSYNFFGYDHDELRQRAIIGVWKALRTTNYPDIRGFICLVTRRRLGEVWKQIKKDQKIGKTLFENKEENRIISRELNPLDSVILSEEIELAKSRQITVIPSPRKAKPTAWKLICNKSVRRKDGERFGTLTLAARTIKRGTKSLFNAIQSGYTCAGSKWEWAEN